MKISIHTLSKLEANSIAEAIEKMAQESDDISSGVIGSSFSCSGPGSGWQRNHDVTDYAQRALDGGYGASSYIDSADGREATMGEDGEIEWTEDSVVEVELPTVEEAMEDPAGAKIILDQAAQYGADEEEIEELQEKIAKPYELDGCGGKEYAATLDEAASMAEDWFDYLLDDERLEDVPAPELDASSLAALNTSLRNWQEEIAEALGKAAWAGHGNYYVSAADAAGLDLTASIRE